MKKTNLIIQFTAKKMLPLTIVYAVYILINGHITPGGGFQSGVLFAAAIIVYTLAFNIEQTKAFISPKTIILGLSIGVSIYVIMGLLGIILGYNFLANKVAGLLPASIKILINQRFSLPLNPYQHIRWKSICRQLNRPISMMLLRLSEEINS